MENFAGAPGADYEFYELQGYFGLEQGGGPSAAQGAGGSGDIQTQKSGSHLQVSGDAMICNTGSMSSSSK
jgi:hypothetical protein